MENNGGNQAINEMLPCCIVVDTSGSMHCCERELTEGLKAMVEAIIEDACARSCVDLCLIYFSDYAEVISPFSTAMSTEVQSITAGGMTATHEAIALALHMIQKRKWEYKEQGIPRKQPWIWLLTDGISTDADNGSYDELMYMQNAHKLVFLPFAVGNRLGDGSELRGMQNQGLVFKVDKENIMDATAYIGRVLIGASAHCAGDTYVLPSTEGTGIWISFE